MQNKTASCPQDNQKHQAKCFITQFISVFLNPSLFLCMCFYKEEKKKERNIVFLSFFSEFPLSIFVKGFTPKIKFIFKWIILSFIRLSVLSKRQSHRHPGIYPGNARDVLGTAARHHPLIYTRRRAKINRFLSVGRKPEIQEETPNVGDVGRCCYLECRL